MYVILQLFIDSSLIRNLRYDIYELHKCVKFMPAKFLYQFLSSTISSIMQWQRLLHTYSDNLYCQLLLELELKLENKLARVFAQLECGANSNYVEIN